MPNSIKDFQTGIIPGITQSGTRGSTDTLLSMSIRTELYWYQHSFPLVMVDEALDLQ